MKLPCQYRRKGALLCAVTLISAFFGFQSMANPFNSGTTNTIVTSTNYNETLYIGVQNPNNTLLIESNATVSASEVIVGQLTSSTNNTVSIIGDSLLIAGSATTNGLTTGGVIVGGADDGAALSINNASTLNTEFLYVGFGTEDSGRITLTGEGTQLTVAQDAQVGTAGSTNAIDIAAGANLSVGGTLTVGSVSSSDNHVNVSSGGSLFVNETNNIVVINADGDNGIAVKGNGTLQVGGDVNTGTLADLGVTMSKNANLELGGTLTIGNNKIDNSLNIILNNDLSTNTASWSSASLTSVGSTTSDNSLTFTNGATGHALSIMQIGQQSTANGNELNVGGSNSLFIADSDIFVGAQGKNNQLNIGDGGQMLISGNLYLGNNATATGNKTTVNSNGVLNVGGNIIVGDNGSDNTFTIARGQIDVGKDYILGSSSANNDYNQTGGTNTVSGTFIIGQTKEATGKTGNVNDDIVETTGNLALIGTNSTLTIQQGLTVGLEGGGSILTIRDGGKVTVIGDTVIGEAVGDNYIYLQRDSNTQFNVTENLVVGKSEEGSNRFAVYGGTANIGGNFYLGATTNQHEIKNFIYLETTNAALNVAKALYIGASNSINTLDIVDGAIVGASDLYVGTYEGVSNNIVTVRGEGALLSITNQLGIGSSTGTNNSVVVENGGMLNVEQNNIALGSGTNNVLKIADGGTLKTGDWDYALLTGTATNIQFESGSTLHLLGTLTGTNQIDGGLNVVLDGTNALWVTGTNVLVLGDSGSQNTLTVTNGASASTVTNFLLGFASDNNIVTVGGTGSVLKVGADLLIGSITNDSAFRNKLFALDGGSIDVTGDLIISQEGTLRITANSQVRVGGNYEQTFNEQFNAGSRLEVGISTNQTAPNLVVDGKANFESGAVISIFNDGIGEDDTNVIQKIVVSDKLTIDGQSATTALLLQNITIETNLLLDFSVTVTNGNTIVVDNFVVYTLGEAAGLEGQLKLVADEIGMMATNGNPQAKSMLRILGAMDAKTAQQTLDNHYGEKMSSSPAHNAINIGMQSVAEQLSMRADSTRARMGLASTSSPEGAGGPHMAGQPMQGWVTGYKTWVDMSSGGGFDSYDGDIGGFLIGADMSVAEGILVGIAGGSGNAELDKDSNGASTETDTVYGSIYISAGTRDWFADAGLIYGNSSVDLQFGSAFNTTASYDAKNTAIYIGGGKEMIGNYLIITPHATLLANYYDQDSYTEKSSNAVGREVDSFDELYVQSELGCRVAFYTAIGNLTLKPEFRASWLHEFKADEEDLTYTLIGGTNPYVMSLQAPEEDIIKLGAGISARVGEYLELRADLDTRQGSDYSDHSLLGSLRYQF